jgi:hypothetical protein
MTARGVNQCARTHRRGAAGNGGGAANKFSSPNEAGQHLAENDDAGRQINGSRRVTSSSVS